MKLLRLMSRHSNVLRSTGPRYFTSTVSDRTSAVNNILLQKSKIERPGESRESRFLDAPAVARLSGANTKVGGRFGMKRCGPSCRHTRNASAVFKIFVLHPKKTFATISARNRHCYRSVTQANLL